ncbi:hypothetical protein TNCV_3690961 [Trichonephila clavipes]|nr:hypothetical protein TNCV_3690961 [Trichonephila clavipes]
MRPRNSRCSRKKQFFHKLNISSGTMAQTSKGSQLGKLPLWPTDPLYHCRDFRYDPEHKKSGCHSPLFTDLILGLRKIVSCVLRQPLFNKNRPNDLLV